MGEGLERDLSRAKTCKENMGQWGGAGVSSGNSSGVIRKRSSPVGSQGFPGTTWDKEDEAKPVEDEGETEEAQLESKLLNAPFECPCYERALCNVCIAEPYQLFKIATDQIFSSIKETVLLQYKRL